MGVINYTEVELEQPWRPAFIELINLTKEGCGKWVNILKTEYSVRSKVATRESKWDIFLGGIRGVRFWDNRLKWFIYQINRYCLKTNIVVFALCAILAIMSRDPIPSDLGM